MAIPERAPSHNIMEAASCYDYTKREYKHPVRILSLDGGGIRGLIGLKVLEEVEKRTREATCNLFDLIAGASTGSITALALSAPKEVGSTEPRFSAQNITQLYMEKAKEIFPPVPWWKKPFKVVEDLAEPKYGLGLEKVMDEYCGNTLFRDALTEVMVPSFEITESEPWFFQRTVARIDPQFDSLTMKEVVLAATAAPTYFRPRQIWKYAFIDGGVCDNTPSTTIYSLAKQMFHQPDDKHLMLSLGTGSCKEVIPYTSDEGFGEIDWAPKVLGLLLQGPGQVAEKQTDFLFSATDTKKKRLRLQPTLLAEHDKLDDASEENLEFLAETGRKLVEDNDEQLRDFCNQLVVGESSSVGNTRWSRWFS
ncbi:MAG: patatin-like phospholipase family protein [Waddliaceae bacterium]